MHAPPVGARAPSLAALKLGQAQALLRDSDLDAWLLVVRESAERPDPTLRYFLDLDFTWTSFFLVTRERTAALVATFDAPDLVALGLFDEVRTYKEGPKAALLALLAEGDPRKIGLNVSAHDALADGLTAGLRDYLHEALAGSPFASRLVSAAPLVGALRGVKLPEERARVKRAVDETEALFGRVRARIRLGMTAKQIAAAFHEEAERAGAKTAWPRHHCPSVTVGPRSPVGHVGPGDEPVTAGCLIHADFGIVRDDYCSDLQRLWYVPAPGAGEAPEPIRRAYATIVEAIERAARALVPGAAGWEVDRVAREHLASRGYPEYAHALGHHLGRAVHDGGGVLGPRWERYGKEPLEPVRAGAIYTLEPSIQLEGHGLVALEEDVVVGGEGAEFLSRFPRELPILRLA
jgi:Xaa-Pro aminopeptidase